MKIEDLRNKKIHIVGISGTEGSSVAFFLISLGCKYLFGHDFSLKSEFNKNYRFFYWGLSQKKINEQIKILKHNFNKIYFGQNYLKDINKAELIFAASSWFRYKANHSLKRLRKNQLFWNWYNLLLEFYHGTLIGVTGTAGKGTTTHLVYNILKASGKKVWLIGDSWEDLNLARIIKAPASGFLVAELSNRTLTFAKNSKKSPDIAVITNITRHHLDDHDGSFKKYVEVKKEIGRYQKPENYILLNKDNLVTKKLKSFGLARKVLFSLANPEKNWIVNRNIISGHLFSDAIAAIKVAKVLKIGKKNVISGLNKFKAREGRMQFVGKTKNITFINDGASTRPYATMEAIKSFPKNKVNLILEGSRKKPDYSFYSELLANIDNFKVKNVAISGKIAEFLYPYLLKSNAEIIKTKNLTESIIKLYKLARPKDIILLSPANESFGEFRDYRERINKFNKVVNNINDIQK